MTSKTLLLGLFIAALGGTLVPGHACQYCRMAATDPEAARMAAQMHSGGFPLDATINQFQGIAPAAVLTAPPAPDSVVTDAADLPTAGRVHPSPPPSVAAVPVRAPAETGAKIPPAPTRWADAGLLGLCAAGGLFCWRTRRTYAPVA